MSNLKKARLRSGLSPSEVTHSLPITAAAYRRYERGEVEPKIGLCIKLCEILGCSLNEIFGDDLATPPEHVDISYKAQPGQTLHIKIDVAEPGESKLKKAQ
jgi:putative transcriptional regulator